MTASEDAATSAPSLSIVAPGPGARLEVGGTILLNFTRAYAPGLHVAGEVRLDGMRVATFLRALDNGNSTYVTVTLDAANVTSFGMRSLDASAWTERDAAVDAPAIPVDVEPFDAAPYLENVSARYDWNTTEYILEGRVLDNDSATVNVTFSAQNATTTSAAYAPGWFELRAQGADIPGRHTITLVADDGLKSTRMTLLVTIANQAPVVTITSVRHEIGGHILVDGTVSDPDGAVRFVIVGTGYASMPVTPTGGAFHADVVGSLPLGNISVSAVAIDNNNTKGAANQTFLVEAIHATVVDRVFTTGRGAATDESWSSLPQAAEATISFDATPAAAGLATLRSTGEQIGDPYVVSFGNATYGGQSWGYGEVLDLQYVLGPFSSLRVVVEGDFL